MRKKNYKGRVTKRYLPKCSDIAERMGHESVRITYHYAHLFPTKQAEMARGLDGIKEVMGSVG